MGYKTLTIDNSPVDNPDLCTDILKLNPNTFSNKKYYILWASPPCKTFSVASIGHHWQGGFKAYEPKTEECEIGLRLLDTTIKFLKIVKPKYWFIENPRGVMRKVIDDIFEKYDINDYIRNTVTYCQYGDRRMKPTDIWTNCKNWKPKPMCKNGAPCHQPAPGGSRTGIQGLRNSRERGVIPPELFYEIFEKVA